MRCLVLLDSETGRVDRWSRDARSMMSTEREENSGSRFSLLNYCLLCLNRVYIVAWCFGGLKHLVCHPHIQHRLFLQTLPSSTQRYRTMIRSLSSYVGSLSVTTQLSSSMRRRRRHLPCSSSSCILVPPSRRCNHLQNCNASPALLHIGSSRDRYTATSVNSNACIPRYDCVRRKQEVHSHLSVAKCALSTAPIDDDDHENDDDNQTEFSTLEKIVPLKRHNNLTAKHSSIIHTRQRQHDNDTINNSNANNTQCYHDIDANDTVQTSGRHCKTCTCSDTTHNSGERKKGEVMNDADMVDQIATRHNNANKQPKCPLPTPLFTSNTPLPQPHPSPTYSFKKRILPSNLTSFHSSTGKRLFLQSLRSNHANAYFPLIQQLINQSDPAYCGLTTLVLVLNALGMDPNVRWKGGWRWYGNEDMLLERCGCVEEERVKREGISLEVFGGMGRCQGVSVEVKRPLSGDDGSSEERSVIGPIRCFGVDEFRRDVVEGVSNPPPTDWEDEYDEGQLQYHQHTNNGDKTNNGGYFLVTSFSRKSLHQTGDGHFSPIAAYHEPTDSCLVLDVARFKYTPYWVPLQELYNAMVPVDLATQKSRGWVLMSPPARNRKIDERSMTNEEREGKRPAECVPLAGSGMSICPVEKIKVEYCSFRRI